LQRHRVSPLTRAKAKGTVKETPGYVSA